MDTDTHRDEDTDLIEDLQTTARVYKARYDELRKRIEGAAVGIVVAIGDDEDGQPRVIVHGTREDISRGPSLICRRVRLVVLEDEGTA